EGDGTTIRHAQNYLAQFSGIDRLYQQLLAAAAGDRAPIRFNELFPAAGKVIVNKKEVHPAYTSEGWAQASQSLGGLNVDPDADACESHVQGAAAATPAASEDLRARLLARYSAEYKKQWLEFLKATTVLGYGSPRDAAGKLETLAAVPNSSPLLALMWLVSEHTAGGPPDVVEYFQPGQHVVPPGQEGVYLSDDNRQYMADLLRLQNAWSALASDPQGAKNQLATAGVQNAASTATDSANILAQGFQGDLSVATAVRGLLLAPIRGSQTYLVRLTTPSGSDLCRGLAALKRKYPFNMKASQEATIADIDAVFHPELGAVRALFDSLAGALVFDESRGAYLANPRATLNLSPQFVNFFNRAAAIGNALYPAGATQIRFAYTITPFPNDALDRLELHLDGQVLGSTARGGRPASFVWPGQGGGAILRIFPGGFEPQSHSGLWAVTRLLSQASSFDRASGAYEWRPDTSGQPMMLKGKQVVIRYGVGFPNGVAFLRPGFLSDLRCVSRVTR
ncbi:MAG: hypothetical protein GY953_32275, partial [bacterium]|nr:hypothetical protein [bacterium]